MALRSGTLPIPLIVHQIDHSRHWPMRLRSVKTAGSLSEVPKFFQVSLKNVSVALQWFVGHVAIDDQLRCVIEALPLCSLGAVRIRLPRCLERVVPDAVAIGTVIRVRLRRG